MAKLIDRTGKGSAITAAEYDSNVSTLAGKNQPITAATHTIDVDDQGETIEYSHATGIAVTLPTIASVSGSNIHTDDFTVTLLNIGVGDVTISRSSTDVIGTNSQTSYVLTTGQAIVLQTDNSLGVWNIITALDLIFPATANNLVMVDANGRLKDSLVETDGSGNITANVTGNLTGNVTGDVTGDVTGNADTATTASAVSAGSIVEASLADALGVRVLLQEQTASGDSSIDFVDGVGGCVLDTTYDHYILEISALVPATTSTSLRVRFSTDTGSSWIVTNYHDGATPAAAHITVATSITTTSASALSGELHFIGLTTGTHYRHMYGDVIHFNGSGALDKTDPWGGLIGTTAVDGIRLIMSTGNIASGTFRLYGIHK